MQSRSNIRSLALVAAVLGGSMAVASQSDAAIVNITSGFGIGAVNGGVTAGSSQTFNGLFGTTREFSIANAASGNKVWGFSAPFSPPQSVQFLQNPSDANLAMIVPANTMIDGTNPLAWGSSYSGKFRNDFISTNLASFGAGNYFAMRVDNGSGWLYGYFEVTWNATTNEFNILSGAYESVAGQGIMTPSAVPGGAGLAACALLGAAGRRRRR